MEVGKNEVDMKREVKEEVDEAIEVEGRRTEGREIEVLGIGEEDVGITQEEEDPGLIRSNPKLAIRSQTA